MYFKFGIALKPVHRYKTEDKEESGTQWGHKDMTEQLTHTHTQLVLSLFF